MIPRELSNHLCSLMPEVDRLTQCCVMKINKDGKVRSARFTRAVIHSGRRFTYEQVQDILMKPDEEVAKLFPNEDPTIINMLHEAWALGSLLRKKRFADGALDLDMAEVSVTLDDKGKPTGIEKHEYNESHQLIEEFMLLANESAAKLLKDRSQTTIYRIHEDPDPDRLNDYAELARLHGYKPGDLTNKKHIQQLLDAAKGKIEEHAIKIGLLKSLKRAAYFQDPLGHYGLSKADYCHFTSPIRRYADLIVHRGLQAHLGTPPKKADRVPSSRRGSSDRTTHLRDRAHLRRGGKRVTPFKNAAVSAHVLTGKRPPSVQLCGHRRAPLRPLCRSHRHHDQGPDQERRFPTLPRRWRMAF